MHNSIHDAVQTYLAALDGSTNTKTTRHSRMEERPGGLLWGTR